MSQTTEDEQVKQAIVEASVSLLAMRAKQMIRRQEIRIAQLGGIYEGLAQYFETEQANGYIPCVHKYLNVRQVLEELNLLISQEQTRLAQSNEALASCLKGQPL